MAFATDFPAVAPPPSSRRVGVYILLGVVLAGVIGVGVYVLVMRRSAGNAEPASTTTTTANTSTPTAPATGVVTGATSASNKPVVPTTPPSLNNPAATKIDSSLDHELTAEEKVKYGFPKEWTVQLKVVTPKVGSSYVTFEVIKK